MSMTFDEYQEAASSTAVYPKEYGLIYPVLGLVGEAGEVAEKVKKTIRDRGGDFDKDTRDAIAAELGDVLWYLSASASELGISLEDVARRNIEKIRSRSCRGTLHGAGDER